MDDDATLVREAVDGSLPAFTAIWSRHEAAVHDLALALLRDRKAAWEVVNATFLEASERLDGLEDPSRLLVWLLAITRFQSGLVADATFALDHQPALPNADAERAVMGGLVWEATADMSLRDRALLDLNLRHGLDGIDLADALGVTQVEAADLLAQMAEVENALAAYLILRRTNKPCPDLALMLRGWDGRLTSVVAQGMAEHVTSCRACQQTRSGLPSPFTLYASARQAPLPAENGTRRPDGDESLP